MTKPARRKGQRARVEDGLLRWVWLVCVVLAPTQASADWLVTPFVGSVFGGGTNVIVLSPSAGDKKFTFGGSFSFLSDGLFGVEAEVAHTPRFFESSRGDLVEEGNNISTVSGSLIAAVPIAITGYSLRPYLVGGVGLMHASNADPLDLVSFDSNLLALNVGGGVIGFFTNRTGVRFELRNFRNLSPDDATTTTTGLSSRLSFWRATVGVVLRY